jgi:hypothetical protein
MIHIRDIGPISESLYEKLPHELHRYKFTAIFELTTSVQFATLVSEYSDISKRGYVSTIIGYDAQRVVRMLFLEESDVVLARLILT